MLIAIIIVASLYFYFGISLAINAIVGSTGICRVDSYWKFSIIPIIFLLMVISWPIQVIDYSIHSEKGM
jgi:hypothetical protein